MPTCENLDTFPSFLSLWNGIQHTAVDMQINVWFERYMSLYPDSHQKQMDDSVSLNEDYRVTAAEHIFPALPERSVFV